MMTLWSLWLTAAGPAPVFAKGLRRALDKNHSQV